MATTDPVQISTAAWLAAKQRFLDGVGDDVERALFNGATVENILSGAREANRDDGSSKVRSLAAKLEPLVSAVGEFGDAIDVFTSMAPLYLAPIWGSIRVVLVLARKHRKFYERIVDTLGRIGDILPRFRDYQRIFDPRKHHRLMAALSNSYLDIILLCTRIQSLLQNQRHSKFTRVFQPLSPSLNAQLDDALINFRNHRKTVEKEAETAHMIEEADARALVEINKKAERRQKLLSHLSVLNYEGKHLKMRKIRHEGSGTWLLASPEYKSWINSQKSSVLCCYGIPGCGKSVLASSVVDELPTITSSAPETVAAYHFCDYADKRTLDPINIFGSLARALLCNIEIPENVEDLIIASYNDGTRIPEIEEVLQILLAVMLAHKHIIFVVDGLDEASEEDGIDLRSSLRSLMHVYSGTLRFFVSCREDITSLISNPSIISCKIQVQATTISADVAKYVSKSIDMLLATKDLVLRNECLKGEIIKALVEGAKGMFLWVKFVLDDLCNAETDDEIRKMLENLPRSLSETYDRLLGRIKGETRCTLVRRMFQWITCAKRPLLITELQEGIAFHLDDKHWDQDKIPTDMTRLIRACSNLVVVDEESGIVEFAHYTIMRYLLSREDATGSHFHFNLRDANNYVGEVCLAYLSFSDFETQITKRHTDTTTANMTEIESAVVNQPLPGSIAAAMKIWYSFRGYKGVPSGIDYARHFPKPKPPTTEIMTKYCLLGYIVENWLWHSVHFLGCTTYEGPTSAERLTVLLTNGWQGDSRGCFLFQNLVLDKRLMFDVRPWESRGASKKYPHVFAAGWALSMNHVPLMTSLVCATDFDPSRYTELAGQLFFGGSLASGSTRIDSVLVEKIQKTQETEEDALRWFYSKLISACRLNHLSVLQFCISRSKKSATATYVRNHLLIEAAAHGQEAVVRLLCSYEYEESRFTCAYENSPLNAIERAALGGHSIVVSYLQSRGHRSLELDITMAVSNAVKSGDTKVLDALLQLSNYRFRHSSIHLEQNPDLESREEKLQNICNQSMVFAAHQNDLASILILMKWGFIADPVCFTAESPLLIAVKQNQYEMVEAFLIHEKIEVHYDTNSGSPMLWAAAKGYVRILQSFFEYGKFFSGTLNEWPSPLFAAAANGHSEAVELLLQNKLPPNLGCRRMNELHENFKHLRMIDNDEMLAGTELEEQKEQRGWKKQEQLSPLYAAMFNGHVDIMAKLLCAGASVDQLVWEGRIQSGACFWDSLAVVRSLVSKLNNESAGLAHQTLLSTASTGGSENILRNNFISLMERIYSLLEAGVADPLTHTIVNGHNGCYKLLRNAGVRIVNHHAIAATIHWRCNILLDLLQGGANVNSRVEQLSYEILNNEPHTISRVKLMPKKILVPDESRSEGELQFLKGVPLLVIASLNGDLESVKILLEAGAQVDATDKEMKTALLHSVIVDHIGVFEILCMRKASFGHRDGSGQTAMDYIKKLSRLPFLELMLSCLYLKRITKFKGASLEEVEEAVDEFRRQ